MNLSAGKCVHSFGFGLSCFPCSLEGRAAQSFADLLAHLIEPGAQRLANPLHIILPFVFILSPCARSGDEYSFFCSIHLSVCCS